MNIKEETHRNISDGKYLLFCLQSEEFGVEILKVREIISCPKVVPIPKTPAHYKGVMNLRGKMIPVIDLRTLLSLPEKEKDRLTCTIVVDALVKDGLLPTGEEAELETIDCDRDLNSASIITLGITVDSVSEVIQVNASEVEKLRAIGGQHWSNYLLGVAKKADRIISLINLDELLNH